MGSLAAPEDTPAIALGVVALSGQLLTPTPQHPNAGPPQGRGHIPQQEVTPIRTLAITLTLLALLVPTVGTAAPTTTVRSYTHTLTIKKWRSEAEWRSLDQIVQPESSWNPCAYYPNRSDCSYTGSNSCGIPQANPCPSAWRGRMWETRFAQARWLIAYVEGRYGTPSAALAFRGAHGWY